jgi:tetratricopeptide (TPR) repeat protein
LQAHVSMASGRWRDAARWLDSAAALDPVRAAEHAALLHAVPMFPIPRARLEEVRAMVERAAPLAGPRAEGIIATGDEALHAFLIRYAHALIATRLGATPDSIRVIDLAVRRSDSTSPLPASLSNGARAQALLVGGRAPEALEVLETVPAPRRSVDLLGYSPFGGLRHERFLRAEALALSGRLTDADRWFSSFYEHSPYGRLYYAAAHLRRAEIAERLSRREEAARHWARVAALWKDADPEFKELLAQARRTTLARK